MRQTIDELLRLPQGVLFWDRSNNTGKVFPDWAHARAAGVVASLEDPCLLQVLLSSDIRRSITFLAQCGDPERVYAHWAELVATAFELGWNGN